MLGVERPLPTFLELFALMVSSVAISTPQVDESVIAMRIHDTFLKPIKCFINKKKLGRATGPYPKQRMLVTRRALHFDRVQTLDVFTTSHASEVDGT